MFKSIILILSLISCCTCATLFEDQVGRFDWHKRFIGTPATVQAINNGEDLLIHSELNYISLLNSINSSIIWRFEARPEEQILGIDQRNQLFLTSFQKSRSHLYIYCLKTGDLLWEQTTPLNSGSLSVYLDYPQIYHIQNKQTLSKGDITGTKWNWVFNLNQDKESTLQTININQGNDRAILLFTQLGNELRFYTINDKGDQYESSDPSSLFKFISENHPQSCIVYDEKNDSEYLIVKNSNEIILTPLNTQSLKPTIIDHDEDLSLFSLSCSNFYSKGSHGNMIESVYLFKKLSDETIEIVTLDWTSSKQKFEINGKSTANPKLNLVRENGSIISLPSTLPASLSNYGNIQKYFPISSKQILSITKDGSAHLISKSPANENWEITWSRDEALSKAKQAIFLEFPIQNSQFLNPETIITDNQHSLPVFKAYSFRLKWHYDQFKNALINFLSSPINTIINFHPNLLISGTHQLLVFINNDGKITALNSQNRGEKIWDTYLNLSGASTRLESVHTLTFPKTVRNSINHSGAPLLVLGYKSKNEDYEIHIVDGWTGKSIDNQNSDFSLPSISSISDIKLLPFYHPKYHCKLLGLIDSKSNVHIYPPVNNQDVKSIMDSDKNNQFYYSKIAPTTLNGYQIIWNDESKNLISKSIWEMNLPKGYTVYKSESISGLDQMASPGRSIGDRSVLYKYLNPNLLSIIIKPNNGTGMSLMLVDGINGSIIHHISYQDAELTDPHSAHQLLYENVLIYSYTSNHEVKFVVSELYEPNNDPNFDITSINRSNPDILSSAFIYTHSLTSMGITKTNMGITSKEILVSLSSNQLQAIPKSVLDPRRPIDKLSQYDQEEGLTLYNPSLPVLGKSVFSYYLDIANIRRIESHPSEYESTTLILAHGQDIYFTLRHPSNLFDVLSEDFSKIALIMTLLGLIAGIIVIKPLMKSKYLKERWV